MFTRTYAAGPSDAVMKPLRSSRGKLVICAAAVAACSCSAPPIPETHVPAWISGKTQGPYTCDERGIMFSVVKSPTFEGAIVPTKYIGEPPEDVWKNGRLLGFPVESLWTPSADDVNRAETQIREVLTAAAMSPEAVPQAARLSLDQREYDLREIRKIVDHLGNYRRQYMGVVVSGRRRVLCNFFRKELETEPFIGDRWRCDWVAVDDGGFWYWEIQFDVEDGTCIGFRSNGYA